QPRVCGVFRRRLRPLHDDVVEPGRTTLKGDNRSSVDAEYACDRGFEKVGEMAMSAANLTTAFDSELELVERWRHQALSRAGYDPEPPRCLAPPHAADRPLAVELLRRGCSVELAPQILL